MQTNSNNDKKNKNGNNFKRLSDEELKKQLKKQVDGLKKIFEEKDEKSTIDDEER